MEPNDAGRVALHPARQAAAECLRRELHRSPARRMLERDRILVAVRSTRPAGGLAGRLQSSTAPLRTRQPHAGGVSAAPIGPCRGERLGRKLHPRTLALTGGKSGLRSKPTTEFDLEKALKDPTAVFSE